MTNNMKWGVARTGTVFLGEVSPEWDCEWFDGGDGLFCVAYKQAGRLRLTTMSRREVHHLAACEAVAALHKQRGGKGSAP